MDVFEFEKLKIEIEVLKSKLSQVERRNGGHFNRIQNKTLICIPIDLIIIV